MNAGGDDSRNPRVPADDAGIVFLSKPAEFRMADEWYEFATPEHFWVRWRFEIVKRVISKGELGTRVLEVGCGNGIACKQLEDWSGCDVDGCDLNLLALRLAPRGRGGLFFYDISQCRPEWRGHFDSVVLLDTLEHVRDEGAFLDAVRHHIKSRGLLLINVPALPSLYGRYDVAAGHVRRYRLPQLREALGSAGFSVVRHRYWGLTMIPVLILREFWLRWLAPQHVIEGGFQPKPFCDPMLRAMGAIERLCLKRPPLGSSLLVLAQRVE